MKRIHCRILLRIRKWNTLRKLNWYLVGLRTRRLPLL